MLSRVRLFLVLCIMYAQYAAGQVGDTLTPVEVHAIKRLDIVAASQTTRELNKTFLENANSLSVADAARFLPGVVVKDYGGIGGLKTVSVRSLGANHTGVMYDGIIMADAQGGQIDLGRLSLDNIETVRLYDNHPLSVLLPARAFAWASVIGLQSSPNTRWDPTGTTINLKGTIGSFGFFNPSILLRCKPKRSFSNHLSAEYQSSRSDYPFRDYEAGKKNMRRSNSEVYSTRLEYNATYQPNDSNQLKFKAYYYSSSRGLPGAVILYRINSNERLRVTNVFSQLSWQRKISKRSSFLLSAKYTSDHKYYIDPSFQNAIGKLENEFEQREVYGSLAYEIKIAEALSASYATDYVYTKLWRTDLLSSLFAEPSRHNILNNLAIAYKKRFYEINANLLHSFITEDVKRGKTANDLQKLTPAISASVQPLKTLPIHLRASYKKIFRAPTFDDLYYTNVGNTNLRPETAWLYNVGLAAHIRSKAILREVIMTTDFFHNSSIDKIFAAPRQNLFQWSMMNIGKSRTNGFESAIQLVFKERRGIELRISLSYTLQDALDISDRNSALFKTQLPYTPRHSGTINAMLQFKRILIAYNLTASGDRYRPGEPSPVNLIEAWATHDASVSYKFPAKGIQWRLFAEANNISNLQYEIIKYYPMPRFNYRLGINAFINNHKQTK